MQINLAAFQKAMAATTRLSPDHKIISYTPTVVATLYCYTLNKSNFQTWTPDQTALADGGLLVSFKIDHLRGAAPDDHMAVMLQFDKSQALVLGRASALISGVTSAAMANSGVFTVSKAPANAEPGLTTTTSADISTLISTALMGKLQQYYHLSNTGRQSIPTVVKNNIDAMVGAISA
jgi:hypothetical protein